MCDERGVGPKSFIQLCGELEYNRKHRGKTLSETVVPDLEPLKPTSILPDIGQKRDLVRSAVNKGLLSMLNRSLPPAEQQRKLPARGKLTRFLQSRRLEFFSHDTGINWVDIENRRGPGGRDMDKKLLDALEHGHLIIRTARDGTPCPRTR